MLLCLAAHILSTIYPATDKPLSNDQARAEFSIFMAAGFETTSHAITWCLTMLVSGASTLFEILAYSAQYTPLLVLLLKPGC
jgi:hypothetical protein